MTYGLFSAAVPAKNVEVQLAPCSSRHTRGMDAARTSNSATTAIRPNRTCCRCVLAAPTANAPRRRNSTAEASSTKRSERSTEKLTRSVFERAFEGLVIDRMDGNEEIFGRLMGDGEFRRLAVEHLLNRMYRELRKRPN